MCTFSVVAVGPCQVIARLVDVAEQAQGELAASQAELERMKQVGWCMLDAGCALKIRHGTQSVFLRTATVHCTAGRP